jgi:hypothetical protein
MATIGKMIQKKKAIRSKLTMNDIGFKTLNYLSEFFSKYWIKKTIIQVPFSQSPHWSIGPEAILKWYANTRYSFHFISILMAYCNSQYLMNSTDKLYLLSDKGDARRLDIPNEEEYFHLVSGRTNVTGTE